MRLREPVVSQQDADRPAGTRRWRRVWPRWSRQRWLVVSLVLALVVAAGVGWMLMRQGEETAAQSITTSASVGEVTRTVSASGTLESAESESLAFSVSGTVSAVLVELGDQVTEGQALARVDRSLLESELEAAESTVDAAEDDLEDAEDGDSSVQLAAAQAQLTTARDDLRAARQAVRDAVLRAPFSGQVVGLDLEVGDVVGSSSGGSSSDSAAGGMGMGAGPTGSSSSSSSSDSAGTVEIASVDRFVVETTVSSTDLESVATDLQAEVTASGVEETLYGTVTDVGRVATTSSAGGAAFPVTVTLTGEVDGVYGGTLASVEIIVEKRADVLTVPTRAVRSEDGQTYVMVVGDDGSTRRDVEIGETYGDSTEITDGLAEGDQIELIALTGGRGGGGPGGGGGFPGGGPPDGGGGFPGGGFPGGAP